MVMKKSLSIYDSLLNFIEKYYYLFILIIFSLALFNLFYLLKETPVYSWDEARHGISSYEMIKQNQYIINTYGYKGDYWNLKPPLSFWAISLGYKITGFNPLGLRLFSAVAAFLTIAAITAFTSIRSGRFASLITALVLTVSPKYIVIHSARTGDADSLFVFFFTLSMVSMLMINRSIKYLYLAGLGFSLAFLTKSWHAVNIVIIGFLYLLLTKKLFKLKLKEWGLFLSASLLPILLWIALRYSRDGIKFFKAMIEYDLLTRTSTTLEGHIGDFWYYFNIIKDFYYLWLLLLAFGILAGVIIFRRNFLNMNEGTRNYILGITLWLLIPLVVFTKAKTKIGWYVLPLYPAIAVAIGALCGAITRGTKRHTAAQIIVILLIIKAVTTYQPEIHRHIVMFSKDPRRVSFENYKTTIDIRGLSSYVDYAGMEINVGPISEFKNWQQADMLAAELFWDLKPLEGGMVEFLNDKNPDHIIIALRNVEFDKIIKENNLKILGEGPKSYILGK
jgi:4-amino-4-deoxy-L-arabinose transferase-like glycosyltransferase